jgi:hypothetical protein
MKVLTFVAFSLHDYCGCNASKLINQHVQRYFLERLSHPIKYFRGCKAIGGS